MPWTNRIDFTLFSDSAPDEASRLYPTAHKVYATTKSPASSSDNECDLYRDARVKRGIRRSPTLLRRMNSPLVGLAGNEKLGHR